MDAVGSDCQRDVGAGVDQESSSQFSVLSSQFGHDFDCFSGQGFQVAGGEIFFAELDVVDAGDGGFTDFFEEAATTGGFVAGEGGAVGDVVEEAAISHQLSAIRNDPMNPCSLDVVDRFPY